MRIIQPNWPVADNIHAFTTTREGGVSTAPFNDFNLGDHVGDDKSAVKINRALLVEKFSLPQEPLFLTQTHSTRVIQLPYLDDNLEADAVYTNEPNQVCTIMTADCLPVLFTTKPGNEVGPAIGPTAFQVGNDVVEQFIAIDQKAKLAFQPDRREKEKFLGNLYQIATQRLNNLGITQIYGGEHCTFNEKEYFFSYRRDHQTGRMASVIWFE